MRKSSKNNNHFIFPQLPDQCKIAENKNVKVLKAKEVIIIRGRHTFKGLKNTDWLRLI